MQRLKFHLCYNGKKDEEKKEKKKIVGFSNDS